MSVKANKVKMPSISWAISGVVGKFTIIHALQSTSIKFSEIFDEVKPYTESSLYDDGSYHIYQGKGYVPDGFNPEEADGAGAFDSKAHVLTLLYFACVKKHLVNENRILNKAIQFSDERGKPVKLDTWDDILNQVHILGFEQDLACKLARQIQLAPISLSEIQITRGRESIYF